MGIAQSQIDMLALHGGFKPHALDLQLFDKSLADTFHHIVDQRPAQPMKRLGLRVVTVAAKDDLPAVNLQISAWWQFQVEFSFRPLDENLLAFDIHLDLGGNGNWLFSNS